VAVRAGQPPRAAALHAPAPLAVALVRRHAERSRNDAED